MSSNHNTFLVLILVLTFLSVIGVILYYKEEHTQHSLEVENFLNTERKKENKRVYSGECGPGCQFQCNHGERCPNMAVKSCKRKIPSGSNKPVMIKNIPLGYAANMATDVARCAGGINGIMKMKKHNRYGKQFPHGDQMYSFCIEGSENPFDEQ